MYTDVIQLILIRKVNTILRESKLNITLFRLKLPLDFPVFHVKKAGEVIVRSNPHFCCWVHTFIANLVEASVGVS